jgi:hypothetical protein
MRRSSISVEPARAPIPPRALRVLLYTDVGAILSSSDDADAVVGGPLLSSEALSFAGGVLSSGASPFIHDRGDLTRALRGGGGSVSASRGGDTGAKTAPAALLPAARVSVFLRAGRAALSPAQPSSYASLPVDDRVSEDALDAKAVAAVHTALYSQNALLNELTAAAAAESAALIERETILVQLTKQLAHLQNMAGDARLFGADAGADAGGPRASDKTCDIGSAVTAAPLLSANEDSFMGGSGNSVTLRTAATGADGAACAKFPRMAPATSGAIGEILGDTAILAQIRDLNRESDTLQT